MPPEPEPQPSAPELRPLFSRVTDEELIELGVAEPLMAQIRALTTQDELLELLDRAPQLTTDVLFALYDGTPVADVLEQVTKPVTAEEPVDPADFAAALARPATQVSSDDEALQAMLGEAFERWQVFLHPMQRKLVERSFNGPARVGGGPGTGKTIVALHRVAHLAKDLVPGSDKPILLTTFNRNLAADLRTRLVALGGQELVARVDIVNIDRLASRVVTEAKSNGAKRVVDDGRMAELWEQYILEVGEARWPPDFLAAEWNEVILGQVLASRSEYFRARRPGRGRPVGREARDEIWKLTEGFAQWLDEQKVWSWRQVASRAARLEMDRAEQAEEADVGPGRRYRHVVVDEAQDLSAAHWKMLRAMVAPGRNDMFLVGDAHQRIYERHCCIERSVHPS